MPKIIITGRNFTEPDDGALQMLKNAGYEVIDLGKLGMAHGTPEKEVAEAVKDADAVIAGLEPYTEGVLSVCPKLKLISRRGIGYDSVDVEACHRHGVTLCRTAGMVEGSVAEQVMAYILYFARRIDLQNQYMQEGQWKRLMMPGVKTRTLGLVGFGGIGKEIARRAAAFDMKVLYYCRHPKKEWEEIYHARYAELSELLAASDYVSVNLPLTESTRGLCGKEFFGKMKQGSVFINIARGEVGDPEALKEALDSGHLSGAGVDVFATEPCTDSPLRGCENAVLTPHTAPYTVENFAGMNELAAKNVIDFFQGCLAEKIIVKWQASIKKRKIYM